MVQNFQSNIYNQNPYNMTYGNKTIPSKGLEDIKKQDNIAGKIADSYDPSESGSDMAKSFFYSLLMSAGFVGATNHIMKPKTMTDTMTQMEAYKNSRLYKAGEWLDNTRPAKWISKTAENLKTKSSRIPVPQFIKEIFGKVKQGSIAPWDGSGMYSLGKSAEAMKETATYFSKLGNEALQELKLNPTDYKIVEGILEKVRNGKIDGIDAFKKIEPIMKNVSAKTLAKLNIPQGRLSAMLGKLLSTKPDLNLSLSKARFFAGANSSGIFGKTFNKFAALVGEASGGGVLGGTTALLMNSVALMTAFSSAAKAEKGDKLKTFMEDYIGFTIGGYIMSMAVGIAFNKAMGVAELGMKQHLAKNIGSKLGLDEPKRIQDLVIDYNKEFKKNTKLSKLLDKVNKGKVVESKGGIFGWIGRKLTGKITYDDIVKGLEKSGINITDKNVTVIEQTLRSNVKDKVFFNDLRKEIQGAIKSDIKFSSIFKKGTGGGFLNRLGRWVVQKPLATAAKLLSTGRYTLLKDGNFIGNAFRRLKRVGGGLGRMWLVGFVLVEPFRKGCVKLSHAIFGKPKHSALDEEEKDNKPQETAVEQKSTTQENKKSENLVDLYMQKYNLQPKNKTNIFTIDNSLKLKHDTATYIPEQTLGNESFVDPKLTQDFLARKDMKLDMADKAEKNAWALLAKL